MSRAKNDEGSRRLIDWVAPSVEFDRPLALLATTFDLDPEFVETDFLPAVLGLPARNDASSRSRAQLEVALAKLEQCVLLSDASRFAGRPKSLRVRMTPARPGNGGVLHAKVVLLVYPEAVRLIVGSANLTTAGYRNNREVAVPLTATVKQPAAGAMIRQALDGAENLLAPWWGAEPAAVFESARRVLDEIKAPRPKKSDDEVFLWGGAEPLWEQFLALWPKRESVDRITIVSPFWSEAIEDGPLDRLVGELKRRKLLATNAALSLVAAPAPLTQHTFAPQLHQTYGAFDFRAWGVRASAVAANPRVDREDVAGADVLRERALHAKVVLLEGAETALAYLGSANFTRRGWGFAGAGSNIEAGIALRRSGRDAKALEKLIPPRHGEPVPLNGGGKISLVPPAPITDPVPWPDFLLTAEIAPGDDLDSIRLTLTVDESIEPEAWSVAFTHDGSGVAIRASNGSVERTLTGDDRRSIWRNQAVYVRWAATGEGPGVPFPVNAAPEFRCKLAIENPDLRPSEMDLLLFYQGRIDAEDMGETGGAGEGPEGASVSPTPEQSVDTSKILSYQIRSFVEALPGISAEIDRAAHNAATMQWALLGPISPVALGRQVRDAVIRDGRSHTAGGFQLVELVALLDRERDREVDDRLLEVWTRSLKEARAELCALLEQVRAHGGGAISARTPFSRYERVALSGSRGGTA